MKTLESLKERGLTLSRLPPPLHPASKFALPCVVQAELAPLNLIQVGSFSGIFGGRLGHCSIGRYCSIAPGVDIASDQHPTDWLSTSMVQYVPNVHGWGDWLAARGEAYFPPCGAFNSNATVEIGNDVWIGKNAIIKSGVRIGNGAIIAAGAVVIRDVAPYAVVAGVPAAVKRYRFSPELIEKLEASRWWQYNISAIPGLMFKDVERTLLRIEELARDGSIEPYPDVAIHATELQCA